MVGEQVIIPSLKTPLGQLAHSFVLGADPPEEEVLLALYRAYFEIDSTTVKMLTLDVTVCLSSHSLPKFTPVCVIFPRIIMHYHYPS